MTYFWGIAPWIPQLNLSQNHAFYELAHIFSSAFKAGKNAFTTCFSCLTQSYFWHLYNEMYMIAKMFTTNMVLSHKQQFNDILKHK